MNTVQWASAACLAVSLTALALSARPAAATDTPASAAAPAGVVEPGACKPSAR
jgi:hypothetical protein